MAKSLSYINTTRKPTAQTQTSTASPSSSVRPSMPSVSPKPSVSAGQFKKNYKDGVFSGKGYAMADPDYMLTEFYSLELDAMYLRRRLLLLNHFTGMEPSGMDDLNAPIPSVLNGSILGNGSRGSFLGPLYAAGVFRDITTGLDILSEVKSAYAVLLSAMKRLENDPRNYLHNAAFTDDMEGWTAESSVTFLTLNGLPLYLDGLYTFSESAAYVREFQGRNMLYLLNGGVSQSATLIRTQRPYMKYEEGEPPVQPADEIIIDIEDITPEEGSSEVKGKMYLEVRFMALSSGTLSVGMDGNGYYPADSALPYESVAVTANTKWQTYTSEGYWSGNGIFRLSYTGEMFVESVLLTDKPCDEAAERSLTAYTQSLNNIKTAFVTINAVKNKLVEIYDEFSEKFKELEERIILWEENLGIVQQKADSAASTAESASSAASSAYSFAQSVNSSLAMLESRVAKLESALEGELG